MAEFDDEPTVIDGTPLLDDDTPTTLPRCTECATVVFFDDFTEPSQALAFGLFGGDRCVRAKDGHWYWCANLRKYVQFIPKE